MKAKRCRAAWRVFPPPDCLFLLFALCLGGAGRVGAAPGSRAISFQAPVSYSKTGASGITAVDLDADGNLDLIVGDVNGPRLSLLYGRGDGTFEPPLTMNLENGYDAALGTDHQFIGADVNGDGLPDLIVPDGARNQALVFINQGNRSFAPPVGYATGKQPIAVTAADLNGDGWVDLAVSNGAGSISVLLNRGDGTFRNAGSYAAGSLPGGISAADLDGDGNLDLVVANIISGNVTVYLGDGTGKFVPGGTYGAGSGVGHVILADFNGDGIPDIATPNWQDGDVTVLLGNGNGSFQPALVYKIDGNAGVMGIADFDADGAPDLAIARGATSFVSVLHNDGMGGFDPPLAFPSGGDNTRTSAVGDFNNDGRPDIAAGGQDTYTVSVLLNDTPWPSPAIRDLVVSPSSALGGCDTVTAVLRLTAPAPVGGAVVSLAGTNPAAAVPDSVTVPAGERQVRFPVGTAPTAGVQWGTITARYNGTAQRASLAVRATAAAQVVIQPSPVIGGQPAIGKVTIPCPAGANGVAILLFSSSPAVSVPASVTVRPGAVTASFPITTSSVTAAATVTIRVLPPGMTAVASLQVVPPPPPPVSLTLSLFPNPVPGGVLALGEVVLSQPAGPSGMVLTLASGSPAVALVSASVTALPGASVITFPIITSTVSQPTRVTVTASGAPGSATATLQVQPLSPVNAVATTTAAR